MDNNFFFYTFCIRIMDAPNALEYSHLRRFAWIFCALAYAVLFELLKTTGNVMNGDDLLIELRLLEAEADSKKPSELLEWLRAKGVPGAIVFRLARLMRVSIRLGRRIIRIGRIILAKLCEFIEAHRGLAIGTALGAALGFVAAHVPLIGQLLAPVLVLVAAWIGAACGHNLDRAASNRLPLPLVMAAIEATTLFFTGIVSVLRAAFEGGVA